jgi:hypothetical protein
MQNVKYFRYTLKGNIAPHEVGRALGNAAAEGDIVRIDNRGGQTLVFLAAMKAPESKVEGAESAEVSERDVLDVGRAG